MGMTLVRRLARLIRRRQLDEDLAREIEFHREMKQRELASRGYSSEQARLAAARALGNATLAQEEAREVWMWPWLESVWKDGAYAFRSIRSQPRFSALVIAVIATVIGLNTSLFAVFNG